MAGIPYGCTSVGPCLPQRTVLNSQHSCLTADAISFPQPVLTAAFINFTLFHAIAQVFAFSPNSEWCYFAVKASKSKGSGIKHRSLNWRLLDQAYLIRFRCRSKRKKALREFGWKR